MASYMEEYFQFLDALREEGTVNMFGAAPNLMREFNLDNGDARHILGQWMITFAERHKEEPHEKFNH